MNWQCLLSLELRKGPILFHPNVFKLSNQHLKFRQLHNEIALMNYYQDIPSLFSVFIIVSKTGPDQTVWSVEPSTGELSSSVHLNELFHSQTGIESFKPTIELLNQTNSSIFYKPAIPQLLQIFFTIKRPIIHQAHSTPNNFKTKTNYKPIFGPNH